MSIEVFVPVNLLQPDEFAGTSPSNVWNGIPVGADPFDSDRIQRLTRDGFVATGKVVVRAGVRATSYRQRPQTSEFIPRSAVLPVKWVLELADPEGALRGDVRGWECALRLNATSYAAVVPTGVKGANGSRVWSEWRGPNQQHYQGGGFFYFASSAWDGVPLIGSQIAIADNETAVNAWPRSDYNAKINASDIVPVA